MSDATDPEHYHTAIQPLDYIEANEMDFHEGNVIKYVTRWRKKNGVEDLEKARVYLDRLIAKARRENTATAIRNFVSLDAPDIRGFCESVKGVD